MWKNKEQSMTVLFWKIIVLQVMMEISQDIMFILTARRGKENIEPRKLATIKIVPIFRYVRTKKKPIHSFIAKGYDQPMKRK